MKQILLLFLACIPFVINAQEEVSISFPSGDFTLEGTLSIPTGEGPFPAIILVHGSGPSNRNQTVMLNDGNSACLYPGLFGNTIENFKDIADYLSANGIAVLRYDKRSFTHGANLDPLTVSTHDFVEDIESAIKFTQLQTTIDTSCIILAGHSQGSTLIPIAAKNSGAVAGLISLAGPVTPVDSLLPEQYRDLYVRCANDSFSGSAVANQFYRQFRQIREGTFPDNTQIEVNFPGNPSNPLAFGYVTFWRDWITMSDNVLMNYQTTGLPTLIIQGDNDFNVPPSDALRFEAALTTNRTTVCMFEGVNHFLTPASSPHVATPILEKMRDWIKTRKTSTSTPKVLKENNIQLIQNGNQLHIQFPEIGHRFEYLSISDSSGKLHERITIKGQINHQLALPKGMYFLSFYAPNNIQTKKIFITHYP